MFNDHAGAAVDIDVDVVSELSAHTSKSAVAFESSAPTTINPWIWPSHKTRPLAAEIPTAVTTKSPPIPLSQPMPTCDEGDENDDKDDDDCGKSNGSNDHDTQLKYRPILSHAATAAGAAAIERALTMNNVVQQQQRFPMVSIVRPFTREEREERDSLTSPLPRPLPPAPPPSPDETYMNRYYSRRPSSLLTKAYGIPYNSNATVTPPPPPSSSTPNKKKSNKSEQLFGITNPAYKRPHELFTGTTLSSPECSQCNRK